MSERFVRRFAAGAMFCVLALTAITGTRTLMLREQARAKAASSLRTAAGGPPARFIERMEELLTNDQRWQGLSCYTSDGTLRFEGMRPAREIHPGEAPSTAAEETVASLATVVLRIDGPTGRCTGRYRALNRDTVYPVIRDTALAAILLLAIGALTLVAISLLARGVGTKPPPALPPPASFTPDTADSAPADHASGTTPRTRHEPR